MTKEIPFGDGDTIPFRYWDSIPFGYWSKGMTIVHKDNDKLQFELYRKRMWGFELIDLNTGLYYGFMDNTVLKNDYKLLTTDGGYCKVLPETFGRLNKGEMK